MGGVYGKTNVEKYKKCKACKKVIIKPDYDYCPECIFMTIKEPIYDTPEHHQNLCKYVEEKLEIMNKTN